MNGTTLPARRKVELLILALAFLNLAIWGAREMLG